MTRVVQAAGRLLRSDSDRGVIALVCKRFQDSRYARLLPEEWTNGDPTSLPHPRPEEAIHRFFGERRVVSPSKRRSLPPPAGSER